MALAVSATIPVPRVRWAGLRQLARLAALLWATAASASPAAFLERPWHAYETPRFVLYTDLDDAAARRIVVDIERFAAVVEYLVGLRWQPGPIPVEFWLVSDTALVSALANDHTLLGFMRPSPRASYIVATADAFGGESADNVMLHEYVHLLVRSRGSDAQALDLPRWYDEGLAEFLATLRVRDGVVRVGVPNRPRVTHLRSRSQLFVSLGPLLELTDLDIQTRDRVADFYAMSWALVHWLYAKKHPNFGAPDAPTKHPLIAEYLRRVSAGEPPRVVARAVFGSDLRSLEQRLRTHADSVRNAPLLQLPIERFPVTLPNVAPRRLDDFEAVYRLGYVALGESGATARELFAHALRLRPGDAYAAMGLAVADQFDGKYVEAVAQAGALLAAEGATSDPLLLQEYADMVMEWCDGDEPPPDCDVRRAELIRLYQRILALQPGRIEAHAALAGVLLDARSDPREAQQHLERAGAAMPWSMPIVLQSARAALLAGDDAAATALFARAVRWAENARARERLARVEREFACVRALPAQSVPLARRACAVRAEDMPMGDAADSPAGPPANTPAS